MKKLMVIVVVSVVLLAVISGVCSQIMGTCGEDVNWFYNPVSKTLTISGNGEMFNYNDSFKAPWKDKFIEYDIDFLVVAEGITSVGDYAFENIGINGTIVLPESIRYIGERAFCNNSIEHVIFPEELVGIEEAAFSHCDLSELDLSENLNYIGAGAFKDNQGITSVRIPQKITVLEQSLFSCTQLESIYIPVSVTEIEEAVFASTNDFLKHIYYGGTKEQWEDVDIVWDYNYYPLLKAEIHYESY